MCNLKLVYSLDCKHNCVTFMWSIHLLCTIEALSMLLFVILFFYPLLYLVALFIIGGMYSSDMQEINKMNRLIKTGKFKIENLSKKICHLESRVKKNKRAGLAIFLILLIIHIGINWITIKEPFIYKYAPISCLASFILLLGVFWLKGHGTIDDNPRMPGGMRI